MTEPRLALTREQVLAHRRRAGALDTRLPSGPASLRRAGWAGLQDSMPRAAVLSLHARVEGIQSSAWRDPALLQTWGPRFSAYAVPAGDLAVFTLGRLPPTGRRREVSIDIAARLDAFLAGRTKSAEEAGRGIGVHHNALRYGAQTGTVVIHWDGARRPTVQTVPAPEVDEEAARLELVRRYVHVLGPATAEAVAIWAGIGRAVAVGAVRVLGAELTPVRTPVGDGWILSRDESSFRDPPDEPAPARLLPSGDAYFLLQGPDRELLVSDRSQRDLLWTSRVWPGAVLVDGAIVGTWRRAGRAFTVTSWTRLSAGQRAAVEAEAEGLPLPDLSGPTRVAWQDATG